MIGAKVQISCPLNSRKDYCVDEYFKNTQAITYPNKTFYFDDNSADENYYRKLMIQYGFEITHTEPKGLPSTIYMTASMNKILDRFLKSDCDYLFLKEVDVMCEPDTIQRLLAHQKFIVGVPYFIFEGSQTYLCGLKLEDLYGTNITRNIEWREDFLKFKGRLQQVMSVGFGAVLISRIAIEGYKFYADIKKKVHCDTLFFIDCAEDGIEVYRDNTQIAVHKNSSWKTISNV